MSKPVKCFIVEGESRDYRFIQDMSSVFFRGRYELVTIFLAAEQNIYMLYNRLKEDGFETDLIEILREENKQAEEALTGIDRQDIDEVYLMFDYDIHQRNLSEDENPSDVLEKMLQFYNNERKSTSIARKGKEQDAEKVEWGRKQKGLALRFTHSVSLDFLAFRVLIYLKVNYFAFNYCVATEGRAGLFHLYGPCI